MRTLRETVTRVDSRLTIAAAETMQTLMARSVANERYRATLSSAFGGAACCSRRSASSDCCRER